MLWRIAIFVKAHHFRLAAVDAWFGGLVHPLAQANDLVIAIIDPSNKTTDQVGASRLSTTAAGMIWSLARPDKGMISRMGAATGQW